MGDHAEIRNLLARYCYAVDDGDLDGYAELFADGVLRTEGLNRKSMAYHGRDEVRQNLHRVIFYDGSPRTKHVLTNISISVDGDSARARSYFTLIQAPPEELSPRVLLMGNYFDTFARREAEWRFVERVVRTDYVGDTSTHLSSFR